MSERNWLVIFGGYSVYISSPVISWVLWYNIIVTCWHFPYSILSIATNERNWKKSYLCIIYPRRAPVIYFFSLTAQKHLCNILHLINLNLCIYIKHYHTTRSPIPALYIDTCVSLDQDNNVNYIYVFETTAAVTVVCLREARNDRYIVETSLPIGVRCKVLKCRKSVKRIT